MTAVMNFRHPFQPSAAIINGSVAMERRVLSTIADPITFLSRG